MCVGGKPLILLMGDWQLVSLLSDVLTLYFLTGCIGRKKPKRKVMYSSHHCGG